MHRTLGNAFLVANGERFVLFNEQGELIIAKLSPQGYEEIDRATILDATNKLAGRPGRLDAPGVRQQERLHPERQGNRLRVAGEGMKAWRFREGVAPAEPRRCPAA